jgi:hypothetical protein
VKHGDRPRLQPSFGFAVASGAAAVIDEIEQETRILTNVSSEQLDAPSAFSLGTSVQLDSVNEQSRQFSAVSSADVICLAGGKTGTLNYFNFGMALQKPTLPLPFFGGSAKKQWARYHKTLSVNFNLDEDTSNLWLGRPMYKFDDQDLEELASRIVTALVDAVRIKCLICMPFRDHFDWVYESIIEPAANAACADLVRIDLEHSVGDIAEKFSSEIAQADFVIAIVTGQRPNVLYEVGFAHALGKKVLFLCQRDTQLETESLPFYLRNHRTIWYPDRWDNEGVVRSSEELMLSLRRNPAIG